MKPISIGNFDYTQDERGNWIYKASEPAPLKKEKPKYQEKPQFKLQETIEQQSKNRFAKVANHAVVEITKFLKDSIL